MSKMIDLTGSQFGRLTVLCKTNDRAKDRSILYKCQCECGNIVFRTRKHIVHGGTRSCGECGYRHAQVGFREGTTISLIASPRIYKSNTSGVRGVSFCKRNSKWAAYIYLKRRRIQLGYFERFEDAVKARQNAEETYFKPIIENDRKVLHGNYQNQISEGHSED